MRGLRRAYVDKYGYVWTLKKYRAYINANKKKQKEEDKIKNCDHDLIVTGKTSRGAMNDFNRLGEYNVYTCRKCSLDQTECPLSKRAMSLGG